MPLTLRHDYEIAFAQYSVFASFDVNAALPGHHDVKDEAVRQRRQR